MANHFSTIQIPLSLEQLAIALKQLPKAKWEDLELMLDKKSLNQISKSLKEAKNGKIEPFENILK